MTRLTLFSLLGTVSFAAIIGVQASPPSTKPKKIQAVIEAGINGCEKAPDWLNVGPKFYAHVKRSCINRTKCTVGPSQLFSEKDMKRWGCNKGFFVMIKCGNNDTQEKATNRVEERISVFCDGP